MYTIFSINKSLLISSFTNKTKVIIAEFSLVKQKTLNFAKI